MQELSYLAGFGNEFESEALAGALPQGQFSPQQPPLGLYTEKFSNTAFTVPRADNRRTWFYRIRPAVKQGDYTRLSHALLHTAPLAGGQTPPNPLRWHPPAFDDQARDFVDSLVTVAANGDARLHLGIGVHLYAARRSMGQRYLVNSDGELLLVPQNGALEVHTECGRLVVTPGEIVVIPRGMKFKVELMDASARGYVCENYGAPLRLPERGLVGSDGFANTRDFLTPVAHYVDDDSTCELVCKFQGRLYRADIDHCPLDVVAWVGNAVPYKYDLARFNTLGTVSYDHPDPSIHTVLTAPSTAAGIANLDLVVFPPRWQVAEHTFRPPWYHRNVMSEFMGLIYGQYDARRSGFEPGSMSLHNALVPHGPEARVFAEATTTTLAPVKLERTMAFMFETCYVLEATAWALSSPALQTNYRDCWADLARHFPPPA